MKRTIVTLTAAAALLLGGTAHAVSNPPASVQIDCEANESAGEQVCYQLHEDVARSARFREVQQGPAFVMHVILIDDSINHNDAAFSYGLSITYQIDGKSPEYFLNSSVGTAGRDRVKEAARGMLARLSEQLDQAQAAASRGQ